MVQYKCNGCRSLLPEGTTRGILFSWELFCKECKDNGAL